MRLRKRPGTTKSPDMPLTSTVRLVEGQAVCSLFFILSAYGVIDKPQLEYPSVKEFPKQRILTLSIVSWYLGLGSFRPASKERSLEGK
jgi:hypothetical protein